MPLPISTNHNNVQLYMDFLYVNDMVLLYTKSWENFPPILNTVHHVQPEK